MINLLNFQLSMFGDFSEITASFENIVKIMNNLKEFDHEFLPNTITNQNIDLQKGTIIPESRISFITKDQRYNFVIHKERTDFNCQYANLNVVSEEEFLKKEFEISNEILGMLAKEFKFTGNRLAVNIDIISNSVINNNLSKFYKKIIKGFSFYDDNNIYEWSCNTNLRQRISINGFKEVLNIITNLNPANNINNSEKRILCHFDINTLAENMSNRFSEEEIKSFCLNIKPIIEKLTFDFKEFDGND